MRETAIAPHLVVEGLAMAFGSSVVKRDPTSSADHGDIFIRMGVSGYGKNTLLRHRIGTNSVFLDSEAKTMIAADDPERRLAEPPDPRVRTFLTRGEDDAKRPRGH